jgi:hypothetical protein
MTGSPSFFTAAWAVCCQSGLWVLPGWPESHFLGYGIPIVSILVAALLVPLVQFLWRLAWQPWEALKADVVAIRAKVEAPPAPVKQPAKEPVIDKRLTALNYVRSYDDMTKTGLFALRRSEAITTWTDEVLPFLAKHVSSEAAERMLKAEQDERRDLLAEIAEGLD